MDFVSATMIFDGLKMRVWHKCIDVREYHISLKSNYHVLRNKQPEAVVGKSLGPDLGCFNTNLT